MQVLTARNYRGWLATGIGSLSTILIIIVSITITAIAQQPGDLDPTFGNGGKVIDGVSRGIDGGHAVAVQPDGKIVAAGVTFNDSGNYDFALVRYNPDGSLDTSFGGDGKVTTPIQANNIISFALQLDGKIVAAGTLGFTNNATFAIVRYKPDGSLDTSFGTGGIVSGHVGYSSSVILQSDGKIIVVGYHTIFRFDPNGSLDTSFGGGDGVAAVPIDAHAGALQPDGKIVAAGYSNNGTDDFALSRCNTDGSLDTSFDTDGVVTTSIETGNDEINSVAIQLDGKIVAAGRGSNVSNSHSDFALTRYNPNGSLDTSFDSDGIVTTPVGGGSSYASSVAIQSDGKIVALGFTYDAYAAFDFSLARYNSDGSLDTTFDGDGKVITPVGPETDDYPASVAIQSDGKIVAAGTSNGDFAVVRYNQNGSLDTTFDFDGKVTTDFGVFAGNVLRGVTIQLDGKVVAAGDPGEVARYTPDGTRDTTFGGGTGMIDLGFSGWAIATQGDGKIVVAGTYNCGDFYSTTTAQLARFNQDGSLDTSFDGDGKVVLGSCGEDNYFWFTSVAIQPDGKIVAAGTGIVRYNPNGSLDTTFGGGDGITNPFNVKAVAIQPDGRIVAADYSFGTNRDFAVGRLNSDGSLDTSFDGDGHVITPIGPSDDYANSVAIQPDGKIVMAGHSYNGSNKDFAVVRYNSNGVLDTTFNSDGIVTTPVGPADDAASSVAIESDGKLVVAGLSNHDFALARYNLNGSLDTNLGGGDGITTVDFNNSNDEANAMALDGQGRAVVVGESSGAFAIARFLLGPLAAEVSISGRVTTANGRGLGNAIISATDSVGVRRTAMTSTFGYYSFKSIPGDTYTLTIRSKRYAFEPRTVFVDENLSGLDFVALK